MFLDKINYNEGTIIIGGKKYILNDNNFPSINKENPYELTKKDILEERIKEILNNYGYQL